MVLRRRVGTGEVAVGATAVLLCTGRRRRENAHQDEQAGDYETPHIDPFHRDDSFEYARGNMPHVDFQGIHHTMQAPRTDEGDGRLAADFRQGRTGDPRRAATLSRRRDRSRHPRRSTNRSYRRAKSRTAGWPRSIQV
jgi:hypothetical protein